MTILSTNAGPGDRADRSISIELLRIGAWNMNCNAGIAGPYLNDLAKYCHIIVVSEHGLYKNQLHKLDNMVPDFKSFGRSSVHLNSNDCNAKAGIGGCAVLWNTKALAYRVKPMLDISSDRITVIELKADNAVYYIVSVYLPHQSCQIANYDDELLKLKNVLNECMPKGFCIILGDTNAHFSQGYDLRTWGVQNRNAPKLHTFVQCHDMYIADIGYKAQGPCVTYRGGNGSSYVDHVIIPQCLISSVTDCFVVGDCVTNVSDHAAVVLELTISISTNFSSDKNGRRVAWNKMTADEIHELYTVPLEQKVKNVMFDNGYDVNTPEDIDLISPCTDQDTLAFFVDSFRGAIKSTSDTLIKNKYNKFQKPYWNDDLTRLAKEKKQAHACWESAGKKKHVKEYQICKDAKKEFRQKKRVYEYEYDKKSMNEFIEYGVIDEKYFWWLVNRNRRNNVSCPIMSDSGVLLTDPAAIRDDWTVYYANLYKESKDEHYNNDFKYSVEQELMQMRNRVSDGENDLSGGSLNSMEISALIKKLKRNKAAGWDGITAEELKYAGPMFVSTLTWMLNSIIKQTIVPDSLKRGLLVPIPKHDKDSSIKDNNRGITLIPIFYKLLEKVIIEREKEWFDNENIIDVIQSSGKEGVSCLHTSFLVQEAVAYNLNRGSTVHGASLDAKKAFDTVWIAGLMYKLHKAGMNNTALRIIENAYTNFRCAIFQNGEIGEWFTPERGVHQGAPLSMMLYVFYMNDLLKELKESKRGLIVCDINVPSPAHADDVFLLALFKSNLNRMLHIVFCYSVKWRYSFNTDKTKYLVWGKDDEPHVEIVFGNEVIPPSDICKHMGIELCTAPKLLPDMYNKRIGKVKTVVNSARGLGNHQVQTPPLTLSKIYWAVGIPKLTFGLDVTHVNDNCINLLEDAHRQNAKLIQFLPSNTHTPAPLASIGWISISAHIAMIKIMFILRTLCLGEDNVYRRLLVERLSMLYIDDCSDKVVSPVLSCWEYVKVYDFKPLVRSFMENGDKDMLAGAKRNVKSKITDIEHLRWRFSCMLYPGLLMYLNVVDVMKPISWWIFSQDQPHFSKRASAVVSVLMNAEPRGMQCNFESNICKLCHDRFADTFEHTLFICSALLNLRQRLYNDMTGLMPRAMRDSFEVLSNYEKLRFICSGTIKEFHGVMKGMANFIFFMYKERKKLYEPP